MNDHQILTRLHITDIETRDVYAVQASCVCGWLGRIRKIDQAIYDNAHAWMSLGKSEVAGYAREVADERAKHDGEDHMSRITPPQGRWTPPSGPGDDPMIRQRM